LLLFIWILGSKRSLLDTGTWWLIIISISSWFLKSWCGDLHLSRMCYWMRSASGFFLLIFKRIFWSQNYWTLSFFSFSSMLILRICEEMSKFPNKKEQRSKFPIKNEKNRQMFYVFSLFKLLVMTMIWRNSFWLYSLLYTYLRSVGFVLQVMKAYLFLEDTTIY
jgi:hypothetical protein